MSFNMDIVDKVASWSLAIAFSASLVMALRHGYRMQRLYGRLEGYREAQEYIAKTLRDYPDLEAWQVFILLTHFTLSYENRTKNRSTPPSRSDAPATSVRPEQGGQEDPRSGDTVVARRPAAR